MSAFFKSLMRSILVLFVFSLVLIAQLVRSRIIEKPEDHESQYVAMVRTSPNDLPMHPESEEIIELPEDRRKNSTKRYV